MASTGIEYLCRQMWTRLRSISTLALCLVASLAMSQPAATDVYMVDYYHVDAKFNVRSVTYLNSFNQGGYNNQPAFLSYDRIYLTSNSYDREQTDIISLDLYDYEIRRVTATQLSEYSPVPHPDGKHLSTIRVEGITQSLWLYPRRQDHYGQRLLRDISDIGYYHWLDEDEVMLFRLPAPFGLWRANTSTDSIYQVASGIGRCIKSNEDGNCLFVHKVSDTDWYIKGYDLDVEQLYTVAPTLPGSEDFEVLRDGSLLMASGSKVYYFMPDLSTEWIEVLDLSKYGINKISRMAASNNKLILINTP